MSRPRHSYLNSNNRYVGVQRIRRNADYALIGGQYEHRVRWQEHHGVILGDDYIVHHKDHDKTNNSTCRDRSGHCPNWSCGNLGAMTRADHIREHKPGKMGGRSIPNRAGRMHYYCRKCGREKSRNGPLCRPCYLAST